MSTDARRMNEVLGRLWDFYGYPARDGEDDILGVLIRTILSQSTNNENSQRAFESLLDTFGGDWGAVEQAPVAQVAESIAIGGLSNQKAPRIQGILRQAKIDSGSGEHSLEFLREREPSQALRYLQALPGVGPKTARFTLMYAAGADVFPMDTHIFRILERLELVPRTSSDRVAHEMAESLVPRGEGYASHMVLVEHGRRTCHARTPDCDQCPLSDACPASNIGLD